MISAYATHSIQGDINFQIQAIPGFHLQGNNTRREIVHNKWMLTGRTIVTFPASQNSTEPPHDSGQIMPGMIGFP